MIEKIVYYHKFNKINCSFGRLGGLRASRGSRQRSREGCWRACWLGRTIRCWGCFEGSTKRRFHRRWGSCRGGWLRCRRRCSRSTRRSMRCRHHCRRSCYSYRQQARISSLSWRTISWSSWGRLGCPSPRWHTQCRKDGRCWRMRRHRLRP